MNLINLLSVFAVIVLFSCNNTKKASGNSTPIASTQNIETVDTNYRFSVSFISIGAGIDKKAKSDYDQYLVQYEQVNKIKLSYEFTRWGREGEVDYCFKLSELDQKQKPLFIRETKDILKKSPLVRYIENEPCREKRK